MHKKLAAALTISIFLISTFAIMVPVNAHFTLGNLTSTPRYRTNDFDPHYNGVIGYVWPGAGSNSYNGAPGSLPTDLVSPGYQSPYPGGNPPGAEATTWYQLDSNAYAPFGAILTGSTGDLIFAINATNYGLAGSSAFHSGNWSEWVILLPPGFAGIKASQVVSTLTDNYHSYIVHTLSADDRYAPGWTEVAIIADGTPYNNNYINFTSTGGQWYYARINGVTAPTVAGRYFFKMLLVGNSNNPTSGLAPTGFNYTYWVPPQNWPVLLVKGEIDPAIITGTIRYGGYNQSLYGMPVQEAGEVYAQMTTKIDPYTNQPITGGQLTNGVAYFNATAGGHYELEGLAPGVYTIWASAAGYPQVAIATGITILKGQSLHFDGYVNPGVVIHGTVYSKHSFGDEPFPYSDYIKIEIYNQPTVGSGQGQLASGLTPVSWSPLPSIAANDTGAKGMFSTSRSTPLSNNYLLSAYWPTGYSGDQAPVEIPPTPPGTRAPNSLYSNPVAFPYHDTITNPVLVPGNTYLAGKSYDPQGVGPPQTWTTTQGASLFIYQFGVKGEYGAPENLTGMVPQIFSTWVNGLTPGRYYVRAWLTQYVQTQIDGSTFKEYYFDVAANEWAGDIAMPMDLLLGSYVVKQVHLHDTPGTLTTQADSTGALSLHGELVDAAGVIWAHNVTALTPGVTSDPTIVLVGFDRRWDGQDYGIPAGVYTPMVSARGYVQQTFDQVALSLSGTPTFISNHMYRGVGFNVTAYSIDFEQPRVDRNWQWDEQPVYISIQNSNGTEIDALVGEQESETNTITHWVGDYAGSGGTVAGVFFGSEADYNNEGGHVSTSAIFTRAVSGTNLTPLFGWYDDSTHFESGQYTLLGYTYGYINRADLNPANGFTYFGQKGQIIDGKINLIIGANLTVTINFKKEKILTDAQWNMSMRVRIFDDSGNLVGEWMTSDSGLNYGYPYTTLSTGTNYIPWNTNSITLHIAGILDSTGAYGYAGDPIFAPNNYGIPGTPDGIAGYTGSYTVEVDFVNWYNGPYLAQVQYAAAQGATPANLYPWEWYPPPAGLLEGESFHTVPGSPAGIFGYTGSSLAANHLGPYGQEGVWTLPNARLSGEASGIWEVDQRGYVSGGLTAFSWSQERRPVSWATFTIAGAAFGNTTITGYSIDGQYDGFLPGGTYQLTIAMPGYKPFSTPYVITDGTLSTGTSLELQRSNIPVPEFSGLAVVLLSTLAASLYILRRRRQ